MMRIIKKANGVLAVSADGNPAMAVIVVALFYIAFNFFMAQLERMFFGERFEHFLDPIIALGFIGFAGYSVYGCAILNADRRRANK